MAVEVIGRKFIIAQSETWIEARNWKRECQENRQPFVMVLQHGRKWATIQAHTAFMEEERIRGPLRARIKWALLQSRFSTLVLTRTEIRLDGVPVGTVEKLAGLLFDLLNGEPLPWDMRRVVEFWGEEIDTADLEAA